MAVSSIDMAPSKRSRGLADIDPKFVSNVSAWFLISFRTNEARFAIFSSAIEFRYSRFIDPSSCFDLVQISVFIFIRFSFFLESFFFFFFQRKVHPTANHENSVDQTVYFKVKFVLNPPESVF